MSFSEAVVLFGVMVALAAVPSSSVALVITRSVTFGTTNGLAVSAGIVIGDLIYLVLAVLGLSAVADTMGYFFVVIKILGAVYLIWLGYQLFTAAGTAIIHSTCNTVQTHNLLASLTAGLLLTLGDIKAIFFYASLLPVFINVSTLQIIDLLVLVLITILSVGGVKMIYAISSAKLSTYMAHQFKMSDGIRKLAGAVLIGIGGYIFSKAWFNNWI